MPEYADNTSVVGCAGLAHNWVHFSAMLSSAAVLRICILGCAVHYGQEIVAHKKPCEFRDVSGCCPANTIGSSSTRTISIEIKKFLPLEYQNGTVLYVLKSLFVG